MTAAVVLEAPLDYTRFFYDEFASVVRTVALILRDTDRAEDIAEDAFLQLLLNWNKVSRYESPGGWVRRVAIRLAMRALRRDRLWSVVRHRMITPGPEPPSRYDLAGAIAKLPGSQRAAIVLHYYEDRPLAEVAALTGCSEATARVRLHRARRRLAQLLGEADVP